MSEWKPTDDEAASMFIMGWCCDTNPETARTEPASAWSRWLAAHDRELRVQVAREYGIGDLTSRPLRDAQDRIGQLEVLVNYLRRENRRLDACLARGEDE